MGFGGLVGTGAAIARGVEHPRLTVCMLEQAATAEQPKGGIRGLIDSVASSKAVLNSDLGISKLPITVAAGVAELFAYRLSQACGVRVAPVQLTATEPDDFRNFVKRVPGGWAISERVQSAIPLYFLGGHTDTVPNELYHGPDRMFRGSFLALLDKRCPVDRAAYADFPADPPALALQAAKWNSPERLKGHAFRALLYCSHAHTSNCLVDTEGTLTLIDHEKIIYRADTADLDNLHSLVKGSGVADICAQIGARISEPAIREALEEIPRPFWMAMAKGKRPVYSDAEAFSRYLIARLRRWQALFNQGEEAAYAG